MQKCAYVVYSLPLFHCLKITCARARERMMIYSCPLNIVRYYILLHSLRRVKRMVNWLWHLLTFSLARCLATINWHARLCHVVQHHNRQPACCFHIVSANLSLRCQPPVYFQRIGFVQRRTSAAFIHLVGATGNHYYYGF